MQGFAQYAHCGCERFADLESLIRRKIKGVVNLDLFIYRFKFKTFDAVEEAPFHHGMREIIDH